MPTARLRLPRNLARFPKPPRPLSLTPAVLAPPGATPGKSEPATAAAAAQPLPLDDELPRTRGWEVGPRRLRLLIAIGALALAFRIILLPFGHYWDLTVDYNTFIDLAHGQSPYETFRVMSNIAHAAGWERVYEYYAYPPVPLYIYWLPAQIFHLLHPAAGYVFPVSTTTATPILPPDFYLLFKAPIWLADFGIAALLARMSGTIRGWRDYLLNPYVLLISGVWTFDAIMVLGLVAAVYLIARGRPGWAGVALAFGAMVKYIPALAAPAIILYLIKKRRPMREILLFTGAFIAACIIFAGPFWRGLLTVVTFHSGRVGGGMNWEMIFSQAWLFPSTQNLSALQIAVASFGTPTLIITLLLAWWWVFVRDMSLNHMILITLFAFFVGSKLVNEQYALVALPFLWLEARRSGGVWRWFYRLFWIIPLAFAIMHVPIDHFLYTAYHTLFRHSADIVNGTGATGLNYPVLPWASPRFTPILYTLLGVAFTILSLVALFWPAPPWSYAPAPTPATSSESASETALPPATSSESEQEIAPVIAPVTITGESHI